LSNKKIYGILAVALCILMVSPVLADVFVPPGPPANQSEWISPTLAVFTNTAGKLSSVSPIGWTYTDGPTYNTLTGVVGAQIQKEDPSVYTATGISSSALSSGTTNIPYGQAVTIVGFVPGVTVAVDQVPPPVEIQLNWNGVPNTVTLSVPASQVVGINYPPTMYPNINTPYQFAYPTTPKQNATYNLWVGNAAQVLSKLWGTTTAPSWWNAVYGGQGNGEWFWYTFTPNVGDTIALDSNAQTRAGPTYDITAMFEYGTSQIWFNHVAFDVSFLQLHKDVSYCTGQTINDQITISNVGLVTATGLDLTQTFPSAYKLSIVPDYSTAMAQIVNKDGSVAVSWMPLTNFWAIAYPNDYNFTAPFASLAPGQNMTITMTLDVYNTGSTWTGTIVFDSMLSASQIPAWKDPIGLAALVYPMGATLTGSPVSLWDGLYLAPSTVFGEAGTHIDFDTINAIGGVSSIVIGPILRIQLSLPMMSMTLDPSPVPLIAGETSVTSADVALVRSAMLGLAPYDQRMDTNGNGRIDVQDLKAYEIAAGV
jgi:hypothetical protein